MDSIPANNNTPLLVVQVEPPQRETGGDYYYRTYAPGTAMAQQEGVYVLNLTNIHRRKTEIMRAANVLILKHICDPDVLPVINERKRLKKVTIFEIADDVSAVPPWSPVHSFYKNQENLMLFKRIAFCCDAVQFSVPHLKKIYGYLNQSSCVFPNQICTVPPGKARKRGPGMVVGWGGSDGHLEDMAEIAEPLIQWILSRRDVYLYVMCADPIWALFDRLPKARKRRFLPGSLSNYYDFLRKINIGIAPLKDTVFNRSRSDVKFLEYAVHGVAPVVQASTAYLSTIRHGETGFLFEDAADMVGLLGKLADDPSLVSKVGQTAQDYVLRERIQHRHGKERIAFYRKKWMAINGHMDCEDAKKLFETFSHIEGAARHGRHVRMTPTPFESFLHDGLVLSQLEGKPGQACSLFSQASSLEPANYMPYLLNSACCADPSGSLIQALKREPNSIRSWILLGEAYAKKGGITQAIKCFESAAEVFSEYEISYLRTATLLQKWGCEKESRYLSEKARAMIFPLLGPARDQR